MIKGLVLLLLIISYSFCFATQPDSTANHKYEYNPASLILPLSLITYGVIGIESDGLKLYNNEIKEEVNEHIDERMTIDDFSQYFPLSTVFVLNAFGVKGKHNLKEQSIILSSAYTLVGISVLGLKYFTGVKRPDGSSKNSFPSGHTATAFMGAELLCHEYGNLSVWYSVAGYAVAAGTGAFRMYNDRHWFTDVVAGSGFGILSTRLSYMLYERNIIPDFLSGILPYYYDNLVGLTITF